jgi:hypothetical protein
MRKKLDCVCGHEYGDHSGASCEASPCVFKTETYPYVCLCSAYDPNGKNPELENILCPRCRKVRLEKPYHKTYVCPVCSYVMLERQVMELLG